VKSRRHRAIVWSQIGMKNKNYYFHKEMRCGNKNFTPIVFIQHISRKNILETNIESQRENNK